MVLFFKDGGMFVTACKCFLKETRNISLQMTATKLPIKHWGCLQKWRLCASFVYKAASQSSKTSVWTKWKEKRKKSFFTPSLPETYRNISFNQNYARYKVTMWQGEPGHTCASTYNLKVFNNSCVGQKQSSERNCPMGTLCVCSLISYRISLGVFS